ncbi:T9SS type A sorting domain-containing protein [Marinifilum sp. RC60d5]|uniref:T9SS type A sorting domain-containing protein n=1 Tax=Marinifilum sp. RC60d5 TaxID=3458414 RepID=UPI00403656E5
MYLYSITGSLLFKEQHRSSSGKARITKSVQQLGSGVYLLVIELDGYRKSYKVLKQ